MSAIRTPFDTCSLCPRLCRSACPVSSAGRELATPTWIATVLRDWRRGQAADEDAATVATLCTDCGACRSACHLDRPVPDLLRAVRAELRDRGVLEVPRPEPLRAVEGEGDAVVVEADARPLADRLGRRAGRPVRRWTTGDRLGVAAIESRDWPAHAAGLRARAGAGPVVVADGGAAEALGAAGVAAVWAWDWLGQAGLPAPPRGLASCACAGDRPLACCGGAGPLVHHHPEEAKRVARLFADRAEGAAVADARCRAHLRAAGIDTTDWIDALCEEDP